jgi:hypothetical protein
LYPLAGLAVLFARPREQARRAAGIVLAFSLLYACFILRDLILMEAATPRGAWIAYGWQVPVLWFAEAGGRPDPVVLFAAGVLLVMVLLGSIRIGARMSGNSITASGRRLDAFRMGAACYAGSFLLGSSFQYRLIFLLPALPQLLEWGAQAGPFRGYARTGVGAGLLSLWALGLDALLRPWPVGGAAGFWAEQAANWILLAVSMILLTATLPGWAVGPLQRWMSTRVLPTGVPQRNEPR